MIASTMGAGNPKTMLAREVRKVFLRVVENIALLK